MRRAMNLRGVPQAPTVTLEAISDGWRFDGIDLSSQPSGTEIRMRDFKGRYVSLNGWFENGDPAAPVDPRVYTGGELTVEGHRLHREATGEDLRVYLDGIDVTEDCIHAAPGPVPSDGHVTHLLHNADGSLAVQHSGSVLHHYRQGHVEIRPKEQP